MITQPYAPLFLKYSSFSRTKRIIARCLRWLQKFRHFIKLSENLQIEELQNAEKVIVRAAQKSAFNYEINCLQKDKPLKENNNLICLDPFFDEDGIIRVGGRIQKALIPYASRHPIILPKNNHITNIIIQEYNLNNLHSGCQATLNSMRQKFWPIQGKSQVQGVIHRCIPCLRAKPQLSSYEMGNLPTVRINQSRVFSKVGVDYCGPFYTKERLRYNRAKIKTYVTIFICMSTKAVHIEVVRDLTTESFLATLKRFIGRRGLPSKIYADNGSNFCGAKNELHELYNLLSSHEFKDKITDYMHEKAIEWHFIPPRAPNFGGLWEAAVKSFKHHLKRSVDDRILAYDELETVCVEIEAILNSQPLTPLSSDPNDLEALTPGHFLIGDSLRRLPEQNYQDTPDNRLSAWEQLTKIKQRFWDRWHLEYLNTLISRKKQSISGEKLEPGLMVLIADDNPCSLKWSLGRITEVHPGEDGIVRTVSVKMKNGIVKRPASKIAVLSIYTIKDTNL